MRALKTHYSRVNRQQKQSPAGTKASERSVSQFDVEKATTAEFKQLSKEEKAKMRGGFV